MNELAKYKFQTSYSKFRNDLKRKELFTESVDRIMEMHYNKYINIIDKKDIDKFNNMFFNATNAYKDKYFLGSQRALQFGGEPIIKHNSKMYNCLTSYADRLSFFNECMYWLLSGCGVGFSVQYKHFNKLPKFNNNKINGTKTFVIQDSIEGWSDAIGVLVSSYFKDKDNKFQDYQNCRIEFDYSLIRKKGSYINGGFKAPGPDGLRNSIIKIIDLLDSIENNEFKTIHAYDIVMHMSDAVLSGGVRRSATICLFSPEDNDMLNAKTGNWFIENPQRARSNNSVLLVRNKVTREQFSEIMKSVKSWGEPGFVFSDDEDILYNPCVEIGMFPQTIDGRSGWQGCNLTTINAKKCKTVLDFYKACRYSAFLGTLQAGYTNFKYVSPESKEIFDREALLGCSITGIMNNPKIFLDPEILKNGAEIIKTTNREVSEMIKINTAARTTCVKPEGNSSVLLGCASGISGEHAKRMFRNIQVNKLEEESKYFKLYNPKAVEESVWSASKSDYVFSFPIVNDENSILKKDLSDIDQLKYVKMYQQNWVETGTNVELCVKPYIRHNVSNTINVENWDAVEDYIFDNKEWFAGISLLSKTGDKDYYQAPFVEVFTEKEIIEKYGEASLFASGLIVDALHSFNNLWEACDTVLGYGLDLSDESSDNVLQRDWVRRSKKFAKNYFKSDIKLMTYCLKDVFNLKKWSEITREMTNINWEELNIEPSYTDIDTLGSIACVGNNCEI